MKKKIAFMLSLSLMMSVIGAVSLKAEPVFAKETRETEKIEEFIWKPTKNTPWRNPQWEVFSNKYGDFPKTFYYNDTDFEGTLQAVEIKATPIESSKRVVWESAAAEDRYEERTSLYRGGPPKVPFPATVESKAINPTTGKEVVGQITKNGVPEDNPLLSTEKYTSWGGWANTGGFYFRFLGNGSSTWSAPGNDSFSFNDPKPPQDFLPYWRFYGNHEMIEDTTFRLLGSESYLDARTGTYKSGMEWADSKQWTGNELRPKTYNNPPSEIWNGQEGKDLVDIHGNKVFRKNDNGDWAIVSRSFDIYTTTAVTALKSYPDADSTTIATMPIGTPFQVTKGENGYYYIAYYQNNDIVMVDGKPSVKPNSIGTGGWVSSSTVAVNLGLTGIKQGGNLNTNRKGVQLRYELINYTSKYTQKYSGNISFQNTYYDEWKIEVKYKGTTEDIRLNNLKVTNLTVTPAFTNVFPGYNSGTGNLKVNFTVSNEYHKHPGVDSYSSYTEIYMGSTRIWNGNITVPAGGSTNQSIAINDLSVPAGENTITVETNQDRKLLERNPAVSDPYADNKATATHLGYRLKLNNLKVTEVSVNPLRTQISPGDDSAKNSLSVTYTIAHEMDSTPTSTPISSPVEIRIGSKVLWSGIENIPQNGSLTFTRTFSNVDVKMGANSISVEVNKSRVITELIPGNSNPYGDNIGTANHSGTEPDTNNFVVTHVKGFPINAQLIPGQLMEDQSLTVNFTLEHRLSATPGNAMLNPMVHVSLGGTRIWTGNVGIEPGGTINKSITVHNMKIPAGNHILTVEVNADKLLPEKLPSGANAYLDNELSIAYPAIRYSICDLPAVHARRTKNVWSERWTKTTYGGSVIGTVNNQLFRFTGPTVTTKDVTYEETYELTEVYFRSKWTRDMHKAGYSGYNAIPSKDIGWVKINDNDLVKIKAGYGFEIIAMTKYETNRATNEYSENSGAAYNGPNGPGVSGYENVTPKVTPTNTPDIMYINMSNGTALTVCEFMTSTDSTGDWNNNLKTFELPEVVTASGKVEKKIFTNIGGKSGIYEVTLSTPRPDRANAFRGYEAEAPVITANKGHLHDFIKFRLEILGQDDLKSHINQ